MVGGVSPGKGGKLHLGLPVFNNVKEVCIQLLNYFFSLILFISIEPPYLAPIIIPAIEPSTVIVEYLSTNIRKETYFQIIT